MGSGDYLDVPEDAAWTDGWDTYLHKRANPEGPAADLWYHDGGCGAWLLVERNRSTHEIAGVLLASEASRE